MINKYPVVRRIFLLSIFFFLNFCNTNTSLNGLFGLLFSRESKNPSVEIENSVHSLQSTLPATAPQPVFQYEYTDMFGGQVFYYSMNPNTPTGWSNQQIAFYAFNYQRSGTVPVYQYYAVDAGGRYRFMYSTNLYCPVGTDCGWYNSGPAFYTYSNSRNYTRPVYAFNVNYPQQRFYYSSSSVAAGWNNGGVNFYVPQRRFSTSDNELEGYASTTSVAPGDTIRFYMNDPLALGNPVAYDVAFYKVGNPIAIETIQTTPVDSQNLDSCVNQGCSWPVALTKVIPTTWSSGLYYLKLNDKQLIHFVVKSNTPGNTSNVLLILPFSTWQAYNTWGGTSTYPDTNVAFSHDASFNRPTSNNIERHIQFITLLLNEKDDLNANYTLEYASDVDLHANPSLLDPYQLVIMLGQNEYISKPMRLNLDNFVSSGGNLAVFGGNTSWFQVRLESDSFGNPNRKLVCYKTTSNINETLDTVSDPFLKTFNWYQPSLHYPENQTFGLSYRYGTIYGPESDDPTRALDFEVKESSHWAFQNTGVQDFQHFGLFWKNGTMRKSLTAGDSAEGDSLLFTCENNSCPRGSDMHSTEGKKMFPTGEDGAPINFRILAYLEARLGQDPLTYHRSGNEDFPERKDSHTGVIIGAFENNGTVFNGGLYNWHLGLKYKQEDNAPNTVSRIMQNVINRLKTPKTLTQKATTAVYQYSDNWQGLQSLYYSRLPFLPKSFSRNNQTIPYKYDGQAFYAYDRSLSGTVPIYQYQVQDSNGVQRFMYSPNEYCPTGTGCLGWYNNGPAFYAYLSQQPGTIPVYVYSVDTPSQRFMYTPNLYCEVGTNCLGWYNNGAAFYVPATK